MCLQWNTTTLKDLDASGKKKSKSITRGQWNKEFSDCRRTHLHSIIHTVLYTKSYLHYYNKNVQITLYSHTGIQQQGLHRRLKFTQWLPREEYYMFLWITANSSSSSNIKIDGFLTLPEKHPTWRKYWRKAWLTDILFWGKKKKKEWHLYTFVTTLLTYSMFTFFFSPFNKAGINILLLQKWILS